MIDDERGRLAREISELRSEIALIELRREARGLRAQLDLMRQQESVA